MFMRSKPKFVYKKELIQKRELVTIFLMPLATFLSYSTLLVSERSERKIILNGIVMPGVSCIGKIYYGGGKSICRKNISQIFLIARAHQYGTVYLIKCMEVSNVCH